MLKWQEHHGTETIPVMQKKINAAGTETENTYMNSAHLYDMDLKDVATEDIPFYLDYAKNLKSAVLDLGCGTGRVAIPMAEDGHTVTGLDLSENMLEAFRDKVNGLPDQVKARITIVHGDMVRFDLAQKFDMVIAPFRVFQALTREEDINSCLECIRSHIHPNGIFIVTAFRPYQELDESWVYPDTLHWEKADETTGCKVVKKHRGEWIDVQRQMIHAAFIYEVTRQDGVMEKLEDHFTLKYYYEEQLRKLLTDAGFHIKEGFGWYDKTPIETGTELIFVCGAK